MRDSDDHGFLPDAAIFVVYAAGVILWAAQPDWLTRQSLLSGFAVTLVISAATVTGDLGRGGEFVTCVVWGLVLATAMAAGILIRRRSR